MDDEREPIGYRLWHGWGPGATHEDRIGPEHAAAWQRLQVGLPSNEVVSPAWVRSYINQYLSPPFDPESAHGREDDLYLAVLRAIAAGRCLDPAACAREAIRVEAFDFDRWYA